MTTSWSDRNTSATSWSTRQITDNSGTLAAGMVTGLRGPITYAENIIILGITWDTRPNE